jgi:hypothetical protein
VKMDRKERKEGVDRDSKFEILSNKWVYNFTDGSIDIFKGI